MITTSQYSVDGTAVKLVATNQIARTVTLHCIGNGAIYINGANTITTSNSFYLDNAAGPLTLEIGPADEIWALASTGTQTVTVLVVTL